jgi:anaerobic magnesium-protoporphyrin IX monomethyl ester cyclase
MTEFDAAAPFTFRKPREAAPAPSAAAAISSDVAAAARTRTVAVISPLEQNPPLEGFSRLINLPRYGTTSVATALKEAGYRVRVFSEFVRSSIDWDFVLEADYVCFGLLSYCALRGYDMAAMIRARSRAPIIFGGSHASVLPEDCLRYCDYAIRNEGEETCVELLRRLDRGESVEDLQGISYRDAEGRIVHNPDRPFMKDIDLVPDPSLDENYRPISPFDVAKNFLLHRRFVINAQILQTSRGCPHQCTFCFGRVELGSQYRLRSIDSVITDIKRKIEYLESNWFYVVDNEFTVNRKRTRELLERMIREFGPGGLRMLIFARIEVSKDEELLDLMKRAGVYRIYLGIESVNDSTLSEYHKRQTIRDIEASIETIYRHGLEVFASLVLGGEHDTAETIRDTFTFLIRNRVHAICMLSLYDFPTKEKCLGVRQVMPDNRFIHHDWRFYNGNFVIHYPRRMRPSTLQREMIEGTRRFYSRGRVFGQLIRGRTDYLAQFQSLKPVLETMRRYAHVLERYERGLYDKDDVLIEEKLPSPDQTRMSTYLPI